MDDPRRGVITAPHHHTTNLLDYSQPFSYMSILINVCPLVKLRAERAARGPFMRFRMHGFFSQCSML